MNESLAWYRQPLLHFTLVGALAWGILTARAPEPEPTDRIEVTDALIQDLRNTAIAQRDREPTPEELAEAVQEWIDTEMLVREAVSQGLDVNDSVVRAHLARKMLFVLQAAEVAGDPTDEELRQLYHETRDRWRLDEVLTVRQAFVPAGADALAEATRILELARTGADGPAVSEAGAPAAEGPVLRGRSAERLARLWGQSAVDELQRLPVGDWTMFESDRGWHVVRVEEREGGLELTFEQARDRVRVLWQTTREQQAAAAELEQLRARWPVVGWPR
jgi:hypothetical protein